MGAIGEAKEVYEQALTAHGNSPELWLRFGVLQCTYLEDASKKGDASVSFATAARLARGTQFAETVDEVRVAFGGVVGGAARDTAPSASAEDESGKKQRDANEF